MRTNSKARLGFSAASSLVVAAAMMAGGAGPATAADSFSFHFAHLPDGKSTVIRVDNDSLGAQAGTAQWWGDPSGGLPGDTLVATDDLADGYGIVAHLSTGRVASTAGHSSPYTDEVSGNLEEGRDLVIWACVVKGSFSTCSGSDWARS